MAAWPGTPLPLVQAPMAGVQDAALALACGAAGALGSLPCAMLAPDALRAQLERLQSAGRQYNANFFCHSPPVPEPAREALWRALLAPYYAELGIHPDAASSAPARRPFDGDACALVESFRPAVVSFHFGLPEPALLVRVRATGARVLGCATTLAEARWLEARGVDAVIAQGSEAGGHRGMFLSDALDTQVGTLALVRQCVRALRVPVVAAGGIVDAAGVAAAFALGAAAVQAGTAYLGCPEATTSTVHRAALANAASETAITNLFSGRPARGIVNRLMRELGARRDDVPAFPLAAAAVAPLRAAAEARGHGDFSPLWCGQDRGDGRMLPAAERTRELARGIPG
jgi:nitronate monooxygenase